MTKLPSDTRWDVATDPDYAAINPTAVVGLAASVVGAIAFWKWPLVAVPAAGFVLSLAAGRKIRRSEGVLAGRRLAAVGMAVGAIMAVTAAGTHALVWHNEQVFYKDLAARAEAVVDEMAAGQYEKVYERMPEAWRRQQASGAEEFRARLSPLLEGAGTLVSRRLVSIQTLATKEGGLVAPAEMRVELERRILTVTAWFRRSDAGRWNLAGVGGEETFESAMKFPSRKEPVAVPGPYERDHDHHH